MHMRICALKINVHRDSCVHVCVRMCIFLWQRLSRLREHTHSCSVPGAGLHWVGGRPVLLRPGALRHESPGLTPTSQYPDSSGLATREARLHVLRAVGALQSRRAAAGHHDAARALNVERRGGSARLRGIWRSQLVKSERADDFFRF